MLKFMRNKLVRVERKEDDALLIHGLLDDDIYSLEMELSIKTPELEIVSIHGKWNRRTTPECHRAIPFLQKAVGLKVHGEGFSQKVHKTVGREACLHYANLLLECCHCAKEATMLAQWEAEKERDSSLSLFEHLKRQRKTPTGPDSLSPVVSEESLSEESRERIFFPAARPWKGGPVIDLHVHTSPASRCSCAPVDLLIEEAKRIGLDGICLTDHNSLWSPMQVEELRRKHDFLVLRGNEITTDQGDVLVFGFEQDIKGIVRLEELRNNVAEAGGFIIAAHPFRGFLTFGVDQLGLTLQEAKERPVFRRVDAVEVMNSKVTEKENTFAARVAEALGLPGTGGSDAHEVGEVGICATRFPKAKGIRNEGELIEALKQGSYSPVAFREESRHYEAGSGKGA